MKKLFMTITTVGVVGLGSVFLGTAAYADSIDDLKDKQTQIEDERATIKANLSDAEADIADVLIELEKLKAEIEKVNGALEENQDTLDKTEADISDKEDEVASLENEIAELEEAIEKRHKILEERVISLQKSGGNIAFLEVLFGSQNFGDFISRASVVNKIADSDAKLMERQEEDKKEVEEKQNTVLDNLEELKDMETELKGMQELIKEQKHENQDKIGTLQNKEEELTTQIKELEIEDNNLAALESAVEESITAASQPVAASTATAGDAANSESSDGDLVTLSKEENENSSTKESTKSKSDSKPSSGSGMSAVINAGYPHIGTPYVWGGKTPSGFDCSGFVSWAFAQGGYSIPSSTSALAGTGTKVSYNDIQPGDIVFFNTYKTNGHVGIYVGGGNFIGAQNSTGLDVASMTSGYWEDKFAGHVRRVN
ncbi:C40 family peptidase [Virgibacillus ainsalahensis]